MDRIFRAAIALVSVFICSCATQKSATSSAPLGPEKEAISMVMASHQEEVSRCYEEALVSRPWAHGEVQLKFDINEFGSVQNASIVRTSTGLPELDSCVLERVRKFVFASRRTRMVTVFYPYFFSQPGVMAADSKNGRAPMDAIDKVFAEHHREIRWCIESTWARPQVKEKFLLNFTVTEDGGVRNAAVVTETGWKTLDGCLLQELRQWTFPEPKNGPVVVTYPVALNDW